MAAETTNSAQSEDTEKVTTPARVVAERWADFTKALAIYPVANVRVQENLEGLVKAATEALAAVANQPGRPGHGGVAILFHGDKMVYDDVEEDIPDGSNLAWLRTRLDRAALAGVEFLPGLSASSLVDFTKQLLAVYLRKDPNPSYESLWPDTFEGLHLVDRRFEGNFGSRTGEAAPYRGGHARSSGTAGGDHGVIDALLAEPEITSRIEKLSEHSLQEAKDEEETVEAGELLERIVQSMPADVMKEREMLVQAVGGVLDALDDRVLMDTRSGDLSEMKDDMTLSTLLYSVCRSHFARQGPELTQWTAELATSDAAPPPRRQGQGHAGDEAIHEDVEALLMEIERLPPTLAFDLSPGQAESRAEELAVLLHYLVSHDTPRELPGLYPTLEKLLDPVGPKRLEVLRSYLREHGDGVRSAKEQVTRDPPILAFLKATGKTKLLRTCGVFDVDWVVKVYPQYFILYLEALDLRVEKDLRELDTVCRHVGPNRMLDAHQSLEGDGRRVTSEMAQLILAKPTEDRLPLASLLLQWHGVSMLQPVVQFLRALGFRTREAFLLHQLTDVRLLTVDYLVALVDSHLGRGRVKTLHLAISEVLCRYVRALGETHPKDPRRLEAIKSLVDFPSANSWYLLRELSRGFWLPFFAKEPAAVRRLARSLLKAHAPA